MTGFLPFFANSTFLSGLFNTTVGLTDASSLTTFTSSLTDNLNTGVAGVTAFTMAFSAAAFTIVVTIVALYAFDVLSRSNSFATSRLSGELDEGKLF
jgi:hypothetical protein